MDKILSGIKNIHFIGIGGIGMCGLAILLKAKGFSVRGSDIQESYNIKMLKDEGIEVFIGHNNANISCDVDLVCYSSAVKSDNPEMLEALNKGITILPRGKLLGLLSKDEKTIAVSGSHGKTTTTSFIGFLLTSLGYQPTVFVGGLPLNYERNAWWGKEYFVIETDESDGSFLYYNPWVSIITNIDHEHLDYHKTIENLKRSFYQFAYQTKGMVIGCGDEPIVKDILSKTCGISYGFGENNMVRAENFYFDGVFSCFDVLVNGKLVTSVQTALLGKHNVLNALAVLSFLLYLGEDLKKVAKLLKSFKGTKRRFQIKKKVADTTFIDDYAHHPTEIEAVLKAARYLNPKRLFVIFQPHRFSRVKSLHNEFSRCFSCADELIVTDIYSASEKQIEGINGMFLLEEISKNFSGKIRYIPKERLIEEVPSLIENEDMVLGLGAGDINSIMDGIINEFENHRVKAQL